MSVSIKDVDLGYNSFFGALRGLRGQAVKVGVGDAPHEPSGTPTDEIAAAHEFGVGVPERSFLRAWVDEKREQIQARMEKDLSDTLFSRDDWRKPFGQWCVDQIRARIWANIPPPLQESTAARKGTTVPLIDSGQLVNAIIDEIEG